MVTPNRTLLTTPAWLQESRTPHQTPWAVLLCKFKDTPGPSPTPKLLYERLFTEAGAGTFNAIRFFRDASHGMLDLTGSRVFDGLVIDANLSGYTAPDPISPGWMQTLNRAELTRLARQAALDAGVPLQDFWGDVIIFNAAIGIPFGSTGIPFSSSAQDRPYACSDFRSTSTSVFGHEMAHAYGLDHSRADGSTDDYRDPWDTMSALATFQGADPDFATRGPGLNAANMRALNWWNPNRVWHPSTDFYSQVIHLRPLHRYGLPGLLAAELAGGPGVLTVEYRKAEGFDGGFPRSAIMLHTYKQGHSYIFRGMAGRSDLAKGERFKSYSGPVPYVSNLEVEVMDIDDANDLATLRVSRTPGVPLPHTFPQVVLGDVPVDGLGGVLVNGRYVPIPPWNPMSEIVRAIAGLPERDDATQTHFRNALTRQILSEMESRIHELVVEIDSFGGPDPGYAQLAPPDEMTPTKSSAGSQPSKQPKRTPKTTSTKTKPVP